MMDQENSKQFRLLCENVIWIVTTITHFIEAALEIRCKIQTYSDLSQYARIWHHSYFWSFIQAGSDYTDMK